MKHLATIILALLMGCLAANPAFYPRTVLTESFVNMADPQCEAAYLGIAEVESITSPLEMVNARIYHLAGNLSCPWGEGRYEDYGIQLMPTVMYNGLIGVWGAAPVSSYVDMYRVFEHMPSPLKMQISGFNANTGNLTGSFQLLDSGYDLTDHQLVCLLIEDNVNGETHVVRQGLAEAINPAAGAIQNFNKTFTLDGDWVTANLRAIAFVQQGTADVVQAASSYTPPDYLLRSVFGWDPSNLVGDINGGYVGEPVWFFNTGADLNLTIQIGVENGPSDWYFNFCDEEGNCYPGGSPLSFSLPAGSAKAFHVNVWIGSSGTADFSFVVAAPQIGAHVVNFHLTSSDLVANDDNVLQPQARLEANHPNPFRGGTTFRVNSEKSVPAASIQVFDLRGRLISETAPANLVPGPNSISWQAPADLPAGIYFYRLKGDSTAPRRMLHVK